MNGRSRSSSPAIVLLLALLSALAACGDATGPGAAGGEWGIVLNSVEGSLTFFRVDAPTESETVGVGAGATPVGFSRRDGTLAVPLGFVPALAVVDAEERALLRTISLPEGSGATGSDFVDDSTVVVANPELDAVSVVNIRTGSRSEVPVGDFPQAVLVHEGRVLVANAELGEDYAPDGPGTVTVLESGTMDAVGTVELSGWNPGAIVRSADGRVWVLNSGEFGMANGSLSVIDPVTLVETDHFDGFGEFPGALSFGPDGRAYVSAFSYGLAVWDPDREVFDRAPDDAVRWASSGTGDEVPLVAVGFDGGGRLYARPGVCDEPSSALRLHGDFSVEAEIPVGTCPTRVDFFESAP